MDKLLSQITLRSVLKFVLIWMAITILMLIVYTFYVSSKKVNYRGMLVSNAQNELVIR